MRITRYHEPYNRSLATVRNFRSPWLGLEGEIDRWFESALGNITQAGSNRLPVDLYEDKDNTYVRLDLPGVKREDIGVELVDGYLNVQAARKVKTDEGEENFSFNRSISVPDSVVDAGKISAAYENGVLTVTLPKREEVKPRKVTVAVQ